MSWGDDARTPTLSRLECVNCGPETVHRAGKCIHCHTLHNPRSTVRQLQLDKLNVWRAWVPPDPTKKRPRGRPPKAAA
jgi:hypothetical protein